MIKFFSLANEIQFIHSQLHYLTWMTTNKFLDRINFKVKLEKLAKNRSKGMT